MDTEVSRPLYNGGRRVASIVRYRIDTRDYTTTLPNVGEKLALGSGVALGNR